jgi:hypothetical protein
MRLQELKQSAARMVNGQLPPTLQQSTNQARLSSSSARSPQQSAPAPPTPSPQLALSIQYNTANQIKLKPNQIKPNQI